jgi:hypothetical protein
VLHVPACGIGISHLAHNAKRERSKGVNPEARAAGASAWMANPNRFHKDYRRERQLTQLFRQEKLLLSVVG